VRRAACLAIALATSAFAQSERDAYRASYRSWREADPGIERDAAAGSADVVDRAAGKAELAAKYGAERSDYLQQLTAGDENSKWLENAVPVNPPPGSVDGSPYVVAETTLVSRTIETFANDPDQGIQKVRQMLERERAALAALNGAIGERQTAASAVRDASTAVELVRAEALAKNSDLMVGLTQMAGQFHRESEAWAQYYRDLADSVRSPATQVTRGPSSTPAEADLGETTPNAPTPRTTPAALQPLTPSITPVPLVRYTGAWTFPAVNGIYHGPQPEFIDLLVNEQNGHVKGTLSGRFKATAVSSGDPMLRLDFEGDFKSTLNQTFDLATSSGAKGTIELIPGDAFNLLEVNIRTDAAPGQITQANVVLIKK
jgi:hypothetical protein